MNIIISCEHGGNKIPKCYLPLFKNKKILLNSHRGWDPGALALANKITQDLSAPLYYSTTSRLLIDLNRSLHHPKLFSEFSKTVDDTTRQKIIDTIYIPYRTRITEHIKKFKSATTPTMHLSIHSFTSSLGGIERSADIGLLYDPTRQSEKNFCKKLQKSLKQAFPHLIVRCNYPYRGNANGLTTSLRRQFNGRDYSGIEIEINQKHIIANNKAWLMIKKKLGNLILDNVK
jgi:predicted N-formylglutamate amidohydrolase